MTRYAPSRSYFWAGVIALGLAARCGWFAVEWPFAAVPALLFLLAGLLLVFVALRPAVTITPDRLFIGKRAIWWKEILRVDRARLTTPLVVHLTLADRGRITLLFPGDARSANRLLQHIRRSSRNALIDGVPYGQFWGHALPVAPERAKLPSPRYKLLREEDEAEVERLYQRLKAVGRLDSTSSSEEN